MSKRGLIGLLFLSIILLSIGYVSSQNVYCDDGTSTSCVHEDFTNAGCASPSDIGKTGCWTYWESSAGVTTCKNLLEADFPTNFGLKWYSNNYVNPCNSYGTPNIKSCVEKSPGNAEECLDDCYKLGGFCTETSSTYNQGSVSAEATTFCKNYKTVGDGITQDMKCVKCSVGKAVGTYPNQNCEVPQISIAKLGGNYDSTGTSQSGYAWALINLTDSAKFKSCRIKWKDTWRDRTTSLYDSFSMANYGFPEDRYTENGNYVVNAECTDIDDLVKSATRNIQVSLVPDGECGPAGDEGKEYTNNELDKLKADGPCSSGNFGDITQVNTETGKEWRWICSGSNPELDSSCSAGVKIGEAGTTGECGNAAKTFSYGSADWIETTDAKTYKIFCDVGNANPVSPTFPSAGSSTSWTCTESTSVSCTASRNAISGLINGVCGDLDNKCNSGQLNDIADTPTNYQWECKGINGGTDASPSCSKVIPNDIGKCGSAEGEVASKPTANLCDKGTPTEVLGTGTNTDPWTWVCENTQSNENCEAWTQIPPGGPRCGNNLAEAVISETCDGSDWGTLTKNDCDNFGYTGGTLACYKPGTTNECHFNTEGCTVVNPGNCADNNINNGEECDGSDWGTFTINDCIKFDSFLSGTLTCGSNCRFDTSKCKTSLPPTGSCSFTSAKWSPSGLVEKDKTVTMLLDGTPSCVGKKINFNVYKTGTTTSVNLQPITWTVGTGSAPTWKTIGKQSGETVNPKYYFTATLDENPNIKKSSLTNLEVADSIPLIAECVKIKKCSEYSQEQCGGDKCGVSQKSIFSFLGGTTKESQKCYQEKDYTCGRVIKNGVGTCENVAVIRNVKTTCPQSFLDGDGANYPDEIGVCSYEDQTQDTCEGDGFLDVVWKGTWSWAEGNKINMFDPTGEKTKCDKTTTKTEPCPSQVVLSFFTIKNIILVVAVIVLIYLVMKIRCRKKKRKGK